jgi:hypothetical protein
VAGCASQRNGTGGMENEAEVGTGEGNQPPEQVGPPSSGANGVISRSNPLGLTAGESEPAQR